MLVGAHVSISGGVENAPGNGAEIQAETIQVFSKNQRQWKAKPYAEGQAEAFREACKAQGYDKVVVHDSYLINLGAPAEQVHKKSMAAFQDEMRRCHTLGIPYLVFHPGAHVGSGEEACIEKIIASLQEVLAKEEDNPTMLLVENTAGQGTVVGYSFEHVGKIVEGVGDERMGVCLDTQHSFAAGYDLSTREGYESVFESFDDAVGLKRLKALHLNDSKTELGSRRDRHENLGDGAIGWGAFEWLVNDPRLKGIPGNLETPGGPAVWKKEIQALKSRRGDDAPDPHD
jgi:deoxyribonuclease IV